MHMFGVLKRTVLGCSFEYPQHMLWQRNRKNLEVTNKLADQNVQICKTDPCLCQSLTSMVFTEVANLMPLFITDIKWLILTECYFFQIHKWVNAESMLEKCLIGPLKAQLLPKRTGKNSILVEAYPNALVYA